MSEIQKVNPITTDVALKVQELQKIGQLVLPSDYIAENALKAAQLILNDMYVGNVPVLQHCTKASISNTLFEMVVQGLNPIKKQCAFIPRGNKLTLQTQYQGRIALAKRFANVKDVYPKALFKGDDFEYETDVKTGATIILKHKGSLENRIKENLIGAFAIVLFDDGTTDACVMNMNEIKTAWLQGQTKGNSPAHRNFPDQMAEKTVSNRALKRYIDGSNDDDAEFNEYEIPESTNDNDAPSNFVEPIEIIDIQNEVIQEAEIIPEVPEEVVEENIIITAQEPGF